MNPGGSLGGSVSGGGGMIGGISGGSGMHGGGSGITIENLFYRLFSSKNFVISMFSLQSTILL